MKDKILTHIVFVLNRDKTCNYVNKGVCRKVKISINHLACSLIKKTFDFPTLLHFLVHIGRGEAQSVAIDVNVALFYTNLYLLAHLSR